MKFRTLEGSRALDPVRSESSNVKTDRHRAASWLLTLCFLGAFFFQPTTTTAQLPDEFFAPPSEPAPVPEIIDVETELRRLQNEFAEWKAVTPATPAIPPAAPQVEVPKYPTARLTGFFHADAIFFDQDFANKVAVGQGVASDGDVQSGADFRRARLAAVGNVWDNISYMLEMDFAFPGRPSFMDVWLDVDDVIGSNNVRVGQFRQPFGMDAMTGVKDLMFLERSLPFALSPFRQIGAMAYGNSEDELATWAISGFRYPTGFYGGNVGDNGGFGLATRVTGLLIDNGDDGGSLLHIGGGYSSIDPANDLVQYQSHPEVFLSETGGAAQLPVGVPSATPPFVNTGLIPTQNVNLFNIETAVVLGSFYAQSEAVCSIVQQQGGPNLFFPGAYAQAGYFLTGESRAYNRKAGVFGSVKPRCSVGKEGGIGAWELAARWSYIDLSDKNIQGGKLTDLTGGLNWYLNPYTKFQLNYIHAFLDSPINGKSDADIFALRAQIDF